MSGNTAGGGAQALLVSSGCTRCHSINGQGGRMGPDLTHVGATKSADWIAAFVKDPNSKKPGSRMPAFKGRIPDSDIQTIAAYLASLK